MITPELLAKVSEHLDKAVEKLIDAGKTLDDAWIELAKHNLENSALGRTVRRASADVYRVITLLDALVMTWKVLLHGRGGE